MNNEQRRGMKPILLQRMIVNASMKKKKTFEDPILIANYSYKTLKPVNKGEKKIKSFGLVIDNKNKPMQIVDAEGAKRGLRTTQERANRLGKRVEQPLPGVIFKNWSLVNFTPKEYFDARKSLEKMSARAKGKRTRNNLKSGRMSRIEANQRKTARISSLRKTMRNTQKELNNLM